MFKIFILDMSLKMANLRLQLYLPGDNELKGSSAYLGLTSLVKIAIDTLI